MAAVDQPLGKQGYLFQVIGTELGLDSRLVVVAFTETDSCLQMFVCRRTIAILQIQFAEFQMRAALMGNDLQSAARGVLQNIAARLGLGAIEFAHIEAVLRMRRNAQGGRAGGAAVDEEARLAQAYKVLECTAQNSPEELSLAYRRQLSRHHPDKLKANGLPDSMIEHAKERTQQIIEAYELIRSERQI